jgi:colicin import membrane protein
MKRGNVVQELASGAGGRLRELTAQPRYLIYAVLVHVAFIAVLVMSFEWSPTPLSGAAAPQVDVVEAVVIDESKVRQEQERLQQIEARKQAEEKRQRDQLRAAEQARQQEEQRLAQIKEEQEQARLQVEKEKKAAQEARDKAAQEQVARDKAAKEQAAREQAARDKAAQEKAARDKAAQEQAARDKAASDQAAREKAARDQSAVDVWVARIKQKVQQNWINPIQREGLRCRVRVKLIPGGDVLDVQIVAGSGDPLFDRSVEAAVRKASPLPVPSGADPLMDRFRDLEFVFNPQG